MGRAGITSEPRERRAAPADRSTRGGQSLIEMAFAAPVLLLILLGTIDLGRMFFDYVDLRSATTEAATYASRNPTDTAGITAAAASSGIPAGATVSVSTAGACTTNNGTGTITVQASSVFRPLTAAFLVRFGLSSVNLSSSTTMRCLT